MYQVDASATQSAADFGLSAKTSRLVLKAAPGGAASTADIDRYTMRETTVHSVGQFLALAELPIETLEAGSMAVEVEDLVPDLTAGRQVILVGERVGEYAGVVGAEELELADVGQGLFTTLVFTTGLAYAYKRDTVVIHANVAPATHGQSRSEVLGSGDAAQAFQAFVLKQAPLTHVSSAESPGGAASTIEVRVNGVAWREAPSFYPFGPADRRYVLRLDDAGKTSVQFGDGERGARLPTGSENVTATYRSGIGQAGLVGAESHHAPAAQAARRAERDESRGGIGRAGRRDARRGARERPADRADARPRGVAHRLRGFRARVQRDWQGARRVDMGRQPARGPRHGGRARGRRGVARGGREPAGGDRPRADAAPAGASHALRSAGTSR